MHNTGFSSLKSRHEKSVTDLNKENVLGIRVGGVESKTIGTGMWAIVPAPLIDRVR